MHTRFSNRSSALIWLWLKCYNLFEKLNITLSFSKFTLASTWPLSIHCKPCSHFKHFQFSSHYETMNPYSLSLQDKRVFDMIRSSEVIFFILESPEVSPFRLLKILQDWPKQNLMMFYLSKIFLGWLYVRHEGTL